ncbi:MAG: NAD(P)/FAD-dependent oxidoreductase, partial [bacterium]
IESGEKIKARAILIASGAEYRRLALDNLEKFEGRGIYYSATKADAAFCEGECVAIVGGGNSAGQAAVFLSSTAEKIYIMIRGSSLSLTMSNYLIDRIEDAGNIEVLTNSEITKITGEDHTESIEVRDNVTQSKSTLNVKAIFSFIGAIPNTQWLPAEIERDEKGFIKTGTSAANSPQWMLSRPPFLLETSRPGVFAAGDVRSMSSKRVAAAAGEGSMTVQFVHEYLKSVLV